MKSYKNTLLVAFFLVFPCVLQAATCDELMAEYKNLPSDIYEEQMYLDSNGYYLTFNKCSDPTDFEVVKLDERVQMGFIPRNIWRGQLNHYNCIFRTVKVEYTVRCANNLKYKGTEYLLSDARKENESLDILGDKRRAMEAEVHEWIDIPLDYLNSDGSITIDPVTGKKWKDMPKKLDILSIIERWKKQSVSYPEGKYTGTPGKLPRPVLLIHGLGRTFRDWGVEGSNEDDVKKYANGSLPDMLVRSNNLDPESDTNGIYFFQARGNLPTLEEFGNSQSFELYQKIEYVMDDFYGKLGIKWRESGKYQIDLVGHSMGGLLIRDMLRVLRQDKGKFPEGNNNAANRINRVVTVNTPHFGSKLATADVRKIEEELPGIAAVIRDIDNGSVANHTLINAEVRVFEKYLWKWPYFLLGSVYILFFDILGYCDLSTVNLAIDVPLTIKGPYIGVYESELSLGVLGKKKLPDITTLKPFADRLGNTRKLGVHLDKDGSFIKILSYNNGDGPFPLRPDGSKITLLPMYSDSAHWILPELFDMAGEEADRLCATENKEDLGCFALGAAMKNLASGMGGYDIPFAEFEEDFLNILLNIQDSWLRQSDGVVETNSQKFYDPERGSDNLIYNPALKGYFLEPRTYAIHNAIAPWEAVLHGPIEELNHDGATMQGMDLLCALSIACDNALETARAEGRNGVLKLSSALIRGEFSERSLDIAGNFDLAPIYISEGTQALSISANGETILKAGYEPGIGSSITLYNQESVPAQASAEIMPLAKKLAVSVQTEQVEKTELLLNSSIATQPSIARKGDSVIVSFVNYSGQTYKKSFMLPGLSNNLTVSVIAESNAKMSPVIIGSAVASNLETQKPTRPPPGHRLAPITLAILHREARGEHENNTSRPQFLVFNATEDTLEFSKVAYYFTADPARNPKVAVDYPYIPVSLENLGGDQWRFVFDAGNQKIAPKAFFPSKEGWQMRLHYSDWYEQDHFDDWSADYNIGIPNLNRKIVIYDKDGKIIWGNEAPGFESEVEGIIPMPKGTVAWQDDAPWETNAFKPRVTVKNTGSVALSDYRAELWFRVPPGKSLSPLNIWHAPESSPSVSSVKNAGGRVWMLDLHFDKHILYPSDSVSEGNIGLNLTDWSVFDKTVCGIALKDGNGNILFGREPSVAECESYEGPSILPLLLTKAKK
jgi:pimeloyl-ACP methyl ester carboxylesterase